MNFKTVSKMEYQMLSYSTERTSK